MASINLDGIAKKKQIESNNPFDQKLIESEAL
jgi:hypothetical protein